jgi:MFS family permease
LGKRVAIFFSATSLAGAFSGLLAAAILNMDGKGGKAGWAWIFILYVIFAARSLARLTCREGIVTVIIGSATFFILPRNPATAKFLSKGERESVLLALERDREFQEEQEDFSWRTCLDALRAPHMWLIFVQFFCSGGESLEIRP